MIATTINTTANTALMTSNGQNGWSPLRGPQFLRGQCRVVDTDLLCP
jgi:hypothetical protein